MMVDGGCVMIRSKLQLVIVLVYCALEVNF